MGVHGVRLERADVERLDALGAAMSEMTGLEVKRAEVLRAAVRVGLTELEQRHGIKSPKQKRR